MCGLVGVAGQIFTAEKQAFRWLHYFDVKRGQDSTGLAVVGDKGGVKLFKSIGYTTKLWEEHENVFDAKEHYYKSTDCKVLMGHNRYATVGKKTAENAHPFKHGKITGAHNGTLTAHWLHKLDGSDKFEVDSEAIFYSIDKNGFSKTMENLHGAWALVYWNEHNHTLNFIRNDERTLYFQWNKSRTALFWASETWMLMAALHIAKIDTGDEKIHAFMPDKLYELQMPETTGNIKAESFTYSSETYKGFQSPVSAKGYGNFWQGYSSWGGDREWEDYNNGKTSFLNAKSNEATKKIQDAVDKRLKSVKDDEEKASALVDKEVVFHIYGSRKTKHSGDMLLADCKGLPDSYELRLYAGSHKRFDEWEKSNCDYKGTIRGHSILWNKEKNKQEHYLIMDLRSISEPLPEEPIKVVPKPVLIVDNTEKPKSQSTIILGNQLDWDPKKKYTGYLGKAITFTEMMKAVNQGCISCGEKISAAEADDILFVQAGRFLCAYCKTDMQTLRYYSPNS